MIGLDDYEPKPKAPDVASVIDSALKTETISKVEEEEEETFEPVKMNVKESKTDFDPYREPII